MKVLFLTWDGPKSTYLQGLFLPIFAALRERHFAFHVLQFTWADIAERRLLAQACEAAGVSYRSVGVWRQPVAAGSLLTALLGRRHVRTLVDELGIDLLMPRGTLAAITAIPAARGRSGRLPVLLDSDGLPHDERVEFAGASRAGPTYRLLRTLERWSMRRADAVMARTLSGARILMDRAGRGVGEERFHVVANARDSRIFKPPEPEARAAVRRELGVADDAPLLVYAGSSLRGKYRGEAMLRFFRHVRSRRSDARLLLLMPRHDEAHALLAGHSDIATGCQLRSAAPEEVPAFLGAADLGLALIHATFSMQAASAIKIAEYLLCGVPVLASAGVGDTEAIVGPDVGRCLAEHDDPSLAAAAAWLVETVLANRAEFCARCRAAGLVHFSLDVALKGYEDALRAALLSRCASSGGSVRTR